MGRPTCASEAALSLVGHAGAHALKLDRGPLTSMCAGTGIEDMRAMPYVRAALAESLRMYPQPPILIRRALADDVLPTPLNGDPAGYPIGKGADIFISVWNLHRCAL